MTSHDWTFYSGLLSKAPSVMFLYKDTQAYISLPHLNYQIKDSLSTHIQKRKPSQIP